MMLNRTGVAISDSMPGLLAVDAPHTRGMNRGEIIPYLLPRRLFRNFCAT